jgi:hypothetical protein
MQKKERVGVLLKRERGSCEHDFGPMIAPHRVERDPDFACRHSS